MIDAHRRGNQERTLVGRNAQNHAQTMPDDRARMRRARWVVAPVVVSMAGCVLQPHVTVPQRLLEEPAVLKCREPNTPTCEPYFYGELPAAIAGADELRRSYYEQMRGETALSNSLLALLIPLSAYALYRGIAHTGESTQDMLLKVGIAGSAAYAGVTLFTSKPRQAIYLAGSDALGCAVVASRPYLFTTQDMGDENAPAPGTFLGDIDKLRKLIASVEASLSVAQSASDAAIAEFNARPKAPEKPVVVPRTGAAAPKPPALRLSDPAALKDETSRKTLAEFNTRLAGKPQPVRPAPAKPESAPETKMDHAPELTAVRAKLQDARRALDQGQALKGQIDMAGPRLRGRARQINDEVSREILKTVPDPSAIFSAVSSIGQNAFRLTGAAALKPIPVTESKRPTIVYSLDEQTRSALRIKVEELTNAAAAVTRWVQQVDGMAATVGRLSECRFTAPGLNVIPDIGSVEMAASSTISFRVSGGTGVPRATVVGVTTSKTPAYRIDRTRRGRRLHGEVLPDGERISGRSPADCFHGRPGQPEARGGRDRRGREYARRTRASGRSG